MKRSRTTLKLAVAAAGFSLAGAVAAAATGGADATVHRVHAGQSIQATIDAASPGDTILVAPGVYSENLTIQKDDITLRAAGSGSGGTVLRMPARPLPSPCIEDGGVNGICVAGEFMLGSDQVGTPVEHVRVRGFQVRDFTRFGVVVYNTVDTTVADTDVGGSGLWGIAAFNVKSVRFQHDGSHDNGQGGFYVGDAPEANALLEDNVAYRNATSEGIGIFLRDASHGTVRGNRLEGNCSGLIAVDTAGDGQADDWQIQGNIIRANNGACTPSDDIPLPLSGLGIAVLGTHYTTVEGNRVERNGPTLDAPISGGIALASSESMGGSAASHTAVRDNLVRGNDPADLIYDRAGKSNRVARNDCDTSVPDGLCR